MKNNNSHLTIYCEPDSDIVWQKEHFEDFCGKRYSFYEILFKSGERKFTDIRIDCPRTLVEREQATLTKEQLLQKISQLNKFLEERDTESKYVTSYFQELMDYKHEIQILENKLKEARQELIFLTKENRIKELEQEVKEQIQKNAKLNNINNDLESEITNLEKQLSKRESLIEDLNLDIEDLKDDINCLKYDLKEAESIIQRLDR